MTMNSIGRLSTIAGCDAALERAAASFSNLEYRKLKAERRLVVHHRIVAKAQEQLSLLEVELTVLNACLLAAGEGRPAREYRCKITKVQWRMQRLELRLEDYSDQALLLKELKLQQAIVALNATRLFMEQLAAHRAAILQAANNCQPAIRKEAVLQVPFMPALKPVKDWRRLAKPQTLIRFLQPWPGKRLVNGV